MTDNPTVYVVDDDPDVRDSLKVLLEFAGFEVHAFESALKFLSSDVRKMDGCLVVDIRMPDMDGLELQDELGRRGINLPIVVVTGHGDVPLAVRAMRAGAVDFLEKPFREEALVGSIRRALASRKDRRSDTDAEALKERLMTLTDREREILDLVVEGNTSKEIARALSISPRTVDIHRGHVMEKMQASNVAELIRMVLSTK
ncbi:MAG TPA: response regulator FixJ [Rhizomicrobium sp.]|nr:response regulator FixJ [Rhizomicrobium sp.]